MTKENAPIDANVQQIVDHYVRQYEQIIEEIKSITNPAITRNELFAIAWNHFTATDASRIFKKWDREKNQLIS